MEFVDFNLAKKLKEEGFPQNKDGIVAMYNENGVWHSLCDTIGTAAYWYGDFDDKDFVCPTISQVLKWLREEKGLHICIGCCIDPLSEWNYEIVETDGFIFKHADDEYSSYEEAALAGIEYTLDNFI